MKPVARLTGLSLLFAALVTAPPALALANRVFVSARAGNDANACDNIATPCKTFAGAVVQLNVEHCVVTGFANTGIYMAVAGHLNVLYTDAKGNGTGIAAINNSPALVSVTIDHCHLDENTIEG